MYKAEKCRICNLKKATTAHIKTHGLTYDEYLLQYEPEYFEFRQAIKSIKDLYITDKSKFLQLNHYGQYYEVKAETFPLCKICGKKQVTARHVESHGMPLKDYLRAFEPELFKNYHSQEDHFKKRNFVLSDKDIEDHLKGVKTLGIFYKDDKTKFMTLDIDSADIEILERVYEAVVRYIPEESILCSWSGKKGYHVDIFFDNLVTKKKVNEFYKVILEDTGYDSKEVECRGNGEQGVKLPLGINFTNKDTKNQYCYICDKYGQPVENNFKAINQVKKARFQLIYDAVMINNYKMDEEPQTEPLEASVSPQNNNAKANIPKEEFKPSEGIERPCIKNILQGVGEGDRNKALGRLTKYYQMKGYTQKDTWDKHIVQWNKRNNPPEDVNKIEKDFKSYWHGDYKLLGCSCISDPKVQHFISQYCDKSKCNLQDMVINLRLDNTVKYNNRLFDYIHKVSGNHLIVYGLLLRHKEGLNTTQLLEKLFSRASNKHCMSKRVLMESLKDLKKKGLVEIIEGNKRAGKDNFYKAIPQGTYNKGYTIATNGAINGAIDGRVTPAEFKLYVLLLKYAFTKGTCFPSLVDLARDLYTSQPIVSKQLKELEKAEYIKKNYVYPKGVKKLEFILLV